MLLSVCQGLLTVYQQWYQCYSIDATNHACLEMLGGHMIIICSIYITISELYKGNHIDLYFGIRSRLCAYNFYTDYEKSFWVKSLRWSAVWVSWTVWQFRPEAKPSGRLTTDQGQGMCMVIQYHKWLRSSQEKWTINQEPSCPLCTIPFVNDI